MNFADSILSQLVQHVRYLYSLATPHFSGLPPQYSPNYSTHKFTSYHLSNSGSLWRPRRSFARTSCRWTAALAAAWQAPSWRYWSWMTTSPSTLAWLFGGGRKAYLMIFCSPTSTHYQTCPAPVFTICVLSSIFSSSILMNALACELLDCDSRKWLGLFRLRCRSVKQALYC